MTLLDIQDLHVKFPTQHLSYHAVRGISFSLHGGETLRAKRSLTILFIAHDLPIVRYLCDRVAIFHKGHLVEICPATELLRTEPHAARHLPQDLLIREPQAPLPVYSRLMQ